MSKKKIVVPFSEAGLNKAADWLEEYAKRQLPKYVTELISHMVRTGEVWAMAQLDHIDTGETLNSIVGIRNGNKGVIVAGGNAIWIEFGTGVVANPGTDSVHLNRGELGIYDWGTYGEGHGSNPNGWFYPDPEGNFEYNGERYSHTLGIPMNPFMYRTAEMLKRECPKMAKEIFSK